MNLPTDVLSANWEKRRAVKSTLLGKRVFQADGQMVDEEGIALDCDEHEDLAEAEGKLWCVSRDFVSEGDQFNPPTEVTSMGSLHPSSTSMEHTKARATSGPVQTTSTEGVDAIRKYLYGI